jgi:Mn-dependent DtxR family transcriptional regulator
MRRYHIACESNLPLLQRVYDEIRERGMVSRYEVMRMMGKHIKSVDATLVRFESAGLLLCEDADGIGTVELGEMK